MRQFLIATIVTMMILVGAQATKPASASSASLEFDGTWTGERFDESGSSMCKSTDISGKISQGYMEVMLHYNGTVLNGWVKENGLVTLENNHARWDYKFSGKAVGNRIDGVWSIGNAQCRGTWYVKRG